MTDIYILIVILILILVNGFFASSEMALVSLNKNKIKQLAEKGNKKAIKLDKISRDSTRYLSTIQVAITLAGFLSSAIAGSNLAENLVALMAKINLTMDFNLAVVLITLVLSFITLVFGELVPKKIALNNPEKIAMMTVGVLQVTMFLTRPLVWLLTVTTKGVIKLFRLDKGDSKPTTSEDEIRQLIRSGHVQGLFQKSEKEMLENIFTFDDIDAGSIMTPRTDIYAIDINDDKKVILDKIISAPYSRIPIFDKTIDDIKGIIHVKDVLIEAKTKGFSRINYNNLLREPLYIPDNIKINVLFKRMQKENHQIAFLLDDYGGIDGIVTLEDILEEIVGNIYDEFDEIDKSIKLLKDGTYLVDALIQIQDLNRFFKVKINETSETLSGLIIEQLGHIPKKDELKEFEFDKLNVKIKSVVKNHIDKVIIKVKE
ncbi:MAG: hemolysin family protein [Candidatus Izemoplasmatales bacterium]|nr:hemolysin family protein [Candidatus Izemoplasmatales bacterium]